jgi:hypothetical protein
MLKSNNNNTRSVRTALPNGKHGKRMTGRKSEQKTKQDKGERNKKGGKKKRIILETS